MTNNQLLCILPTMNDYTLTGPAEITLWGSGCEASHRTLITCKPKGDLVHLDIDISGPDMTHADIRRVATSVMQDFLCQVDRIWKQPGSGQQADRSDIGNVTVKAKIRSGEISYREIDDMVKLDALGNLVLDLLRLAGIPIISDFHPLP